MNASKICPVACPVAWSLSLEIHRDYKAFTSARARTACAASSISLSATEGPAI